VDEYTGMFMNSILNGLGLVAAVAVLLVASMDVDPIVLWAVS